VTALPRRPSTATLPRDREAWSGGAETQAGSQGLSSGRKHGAPVAASGKGKAFPFLQPRPLRGDGSRNRQNYRRRRRSTAQNLGQERWRGSQERRNPALPRRRNWGKKEGFGAEIGRGNGSKWGANSIRGSEGSGRVGRARSRRWGGESSAGLKRSTPRDAGARE